jgi:hypothetical protein
MQPSCKADNLTTVSQAVVEKVWEVLSHNPVGLCGLLEGWCVFTYLHLCDIFAKNRMCSHSLRTLCLQILLSD